MSELSMDEYAIETEKLDIDEARKLLASYISEVTRRALTYIREELNNNDEEVLLRQIRTCNGVIDTLSKTLGDDEFYSMRLEEQGEILTSVNRKLNTVRSIRTEKPLRPVTSLTQSSLFTGSHYEPNMLEELKKEIASSDSIDWLVSFIKWSGLRCIIEELRHFTQEKGGHLRVITTSYMEATDYKAIEELSKLPNTEIRVSFDKNRTRLHAKAYLFKRETGFSTAYIGSSNLSNPALTSGLEWNLKVTEKDSFDIIRKFEATFESYWNDEEFKSLSPENEANWESLKYSLSKRVVEESREEYYLDIQPYHYQKEILDQLQAERVTHGRMRNLVVAATGVGKTVISAFDFNRLLRQKPNAKLLFIAHREEILRQSLMTFRYILKDMNFGELFVGQSRPTSFNHLFMSIQSWNSKQMEEKTSSDFYDFIIVDEFHHAAAPSYRALLNHYQPEILLGLTATPERMDGQNVLTYFEDTIASEMRLTEAIDRKLLSPFHYFCVTDTVNLYDIKWSRKGYDTEQLSNVYTNNRIRSEHIIRSLKKYVTNMNDMKGLGFCVSVEHAKYMAAFFNQQGIPSISLHGDSKSDERYSAQQKLENGEISFIFVVDLYNEGIDIPQVNTIIFLRPTESITVFLQQLGRGLRLAEDKECLTVLDFVGQAHKEYSYEKKFRSLVGRTKHSIRHYVENGFYHLPKGCFFQLEKQAKEYVLRNIKSTKNSKQNLIAKLKYFEEDSGQPLTLFNFMKFYHLSLADVYGSGGNRLFERIKVEAGLSEDYTSSYEELLMKRIHILFHLDSADLLRFYLRFLENQTVNNEEEYRMVGMLYYSFFTSAPPKNGFNTMYEGVQAVLGNDQLRREIQEVLQARYEMLDFVEIQQNFQFVNPLRVHAHYRTEQVLAAFGYYNDEKNPAFREGVKHFENEKMDIFFITLNKSDKDFSPSTLYEDYAINERLFHWQSQSRTSDTSPTAKRYINHKERNHQITLFVREYKKESGYTSPFVFLGTADYVRHSGSKPVSIIWRLHEPMPPKLVPKANKNII
nr:DEAD/DEAH box helicase [Lederbergia citrea]